MFSIEIDLVVALHHLAGARIQYRCAYGKWLSWIWEEAGKDDRVAAGGSRWGTEDLSGIQVGPDLPVWPWELR